MQNVQTKNTRGVHRYDIDTPAPPGYQESAVAKQLKAELLKTEGTRQDSAQHRSPPKHSPVPPSRVDDSIGVVDKVVSERHPLSMKNKRKESEKTDGGDVPDQQAPRAKKARQPSASGRSAASEMTFADAVAQPASTRRGSQRVRK